jgi:hypothetical protein
MTMTEFEKCFFAECIVMAAQKSGWPLAAVKVTDRYAYLLMKKPEAGRDEACVCERYLITWKASIFRTSRTG